MLQGLQLFSSKGSASLDSGFRLDSAIHSAPAKKHLILERGIAQGSPRNLNHLEGQPSNAFWNITAVGCVMLGPSTIPQFPAGLIGLSQTASPDDALSCAW
jgi:hypothetical protein